VDYFIDGVVLSFEEIADADDSVEVTGYVWGVDVGDEIYEVGNGVVCGEGTVLLLLDICGLFIHIFGDRGYNKDKYRE
jgi:hypothetical protein